MRPDTLWVPERIAKALVKVGLGNAVSSCLFRRVPVPKAARSLPNRRPTAARHYETIGIQAGLSPPDEILLVDDIVTRGATLLGAANRLADAFPQTRIRGFSVIRTISSTDEFNKMRARASIFSPHLGQLSRMDNSPTIFTPPLIILITHSRITFSRALKNNWTK